MVWVTAMKPMVATLRRKRREGRLGSGPLQGEERPVVEATQLDAARQPGLHVGVVGVLGGGVDDEEELAVLMRVRGPGDHQVVEDATVLVEELRVALPPRREIHDVGGDERLERARRGGVVGPDEGRLAHVRDVEQAGALARPQMLGQDPGRVLHRHGVAGEGHHAGAERHVLRVERGVQEVG
jgi:hypothetical protein